tara:strand:+ start:598 stop:732 length:135 start_codon:yes stop_codon:yes gene_type:complete
MIVDFDTLAKNMGVSVGTIYKHYSNLTPTLMAKELARTGHPDRV